MKALDTPVLLAILHGDSGAKELLRRVRGSEVATTELNFLELEGVLARGPAKGRARRQEALARLRRSLTVLPLDNRAAERVGQHAAKDDVAALPAGMLGVLATLESNGCEEWITGSGTHISGRWPFRVTRFKTKGA